MGDVYIIGTDMIKFGRFPEKSVPQLGAEAALLALDDAGLTIQDMQALYCGNLLQAIERGPIDPAEPDVHQMPNYELLRIVQLPHEEDGV